MQKRERDNDEQKIIGRFVLELRDVIPMINVMFLTSSTTERVKIELDDTYNFCIERYKPNEQFLSFTVVGNDKERHSFMLRLTDGNNPKSMSLPSTSNFMKVVYHKDDLDFHTRGPDLNASFFRKMEVALLELN